MRKLLLIVLFTSLFFQAFTGVQAQSVEICLFRFNGNMIDDDGNGTCTSYHNSGVYYSSGSLDWIADSLYSGGGLKISIPDAVITENDYSILLNFRFSETSGYRKIVDYANEAVDAGMYVNDQLRLYSAGGYGSTTIPADSNFFLFLTRNGSDDSAKAYIFTGSALTTESAVDDAAMEFVPALTGADRIFGFFHDDSSTASEFTPSGSVDFIRIWNGIADLSDIAAAINPVNEGNMLAVFPNPAVNTVTLLFDQPESGILTLSDAAGKPISVLQLEKSRRADKPVDALPAGIYFLHLNGKYARFVKQ